MKTYEKIIEFYSLLLELTKWKQFDRVTAKKAIQLHRQIQGSIRLKDFNMKYAQSFHGDEDGGTDYLDIREDVLQMAFQDLAPHLRDSKAQVVLRGLYDRTGSLGEDLYLHVKNVRLFDGSDTQGPAVVTIIVDSYDGFKSLIAKDEKKRPDYVHATISDQVAV